MTSLGDIVERSEALRPGTKKAYRYSISMFERFAGGSYSPITVEAWRDHLRRQKLLPQTVNRHVNAVRFAARRMEALGIGPDFARAAESLRVADRRVRHAMTQDEVRRLLDACAGDHPRDARDTAAIILGLRTGLRVSELVQLSWKDVTAQDVEAKGGGRHRVVLDQESQEALADWERALVSIGGRAQGRILRGLGELPNQKIRIYPSISRQGLHHALADRGRAAGIVRPIHPHLFRHTCVSWLLEAGVPPQRVMLLTGHKSMETLSRYVTDLQAESDPVASYLPSLRRGR